MSRTILRLWTFVNVHVETRYGAATFFGKTRGGHWCPFQCCLLQTLVIVTLSILVKQHRSWFYVPACSTWGHFNCSPRWARRVHTCRLCLCWFNCYHHHRHFPDHPPYGACYAQQPTHNTHLRVQAYSKDCCGVWVIIYSCPAHYRCGVLDHTCRAATNVQSSNRRACSICFFDLTTMYCEWNMPFHHIKLSFLSKVSALKVDSLGSWSNIDCHASWKRDASPTGKSSRDITSTVPIMGHLASDIQEECQTEWHPQDWYIRELRCHRELNSFQC